MPGQPRGSTSRMWESAPTTLTRLPAVSGMTRLEQLKKLNMSAHKNTKLKVRKALLDTLDNAIIMDQEHLV